MGRILSDVAVHDRGLALPFLTVAMAACWATRPPLRSIINGYDIGTRLRRHAARATRRAASSSIARCRRVTAEIVVQRNAAAGIATPSTNAAPRAGRHAELSAIRLPSMPRPRLHARRHPASTAGPSNRTSRKSIRRGRTGSGRREPRPGLSSNIARRLQAATRTKAGDVPAGPSWWIDIRRPASVNRWPYILLRTQDMSTHQTGNRYWRDQSGRYAVQVPSANYWMVPTQ